MPLQKQYKNNKCEHLEEEGGGGGYDIFVEKTFQIWYSGTTI